MQSVKRLYAFCLVIYLSFSVFFGWVIHRVFDVQWVIAVLCIIVGDLALRSLMAEVAKWYKKKHFPPD
jgi:hypothetical protein